MDEKNKLRIVIEHLIAHNEDHQNDYQRWAKKAEEFSLNEVAKALVEASEYIRRASDLLKEALKKLPSA